MSNIEEALAIVGAIVAILVGFTTLSTYLRNRKRIRIDWIPVFNNSNCDLNITITNPGEKDVVLTDIGFAVITLPNFQGYFKRRLLPFYKLLFRNRFNLSRRYSDFVDTDGVPELVTLKSSQLCTRSIPMDLIAGWLNTGELAWPYAKDTHGRVKYSTIPADVYVFDGDSWGRL